MSIGQLIRDQTSPEQSDRVVADGLIQCIPEVDAILKGKFEN